MKLVTFGEIMLRLDPQGYKRFLQADCFCSSFAGAESNVAVNAALLGEDTAFVTKLPSNDIAECAVRDLRKNGVDVSHILRGGDRMGIYFVEKGGAHRAGSVIYDRAGSAIATASPEEFCWEEIFRGADWFHFSGITPALGTQTAAICLDACKKAKQLGLTVSCDLNYRSKLWSIREAEAKMSELCQYADVLISNVDQACEIFYPQEQIEETYNEAQYRRVADFLMKSFDLQVLALTGRRTYSAEQTAFGGMLCDGKRLYTSHTYQILAVDRIGSGDAFAAGLIHALRHQGVTQESLDFAVAAGVLNHSVEGDLNLVSREEILSVMSNGGDCRIVR